MAFATIPSWSTTAGTNTEIDGISLAENVMVPSAVNNAFREMMSQVAEFTRRGSDLASAATLDLDSIDTMFLDITGTTTVTAVTLTDGHSRRARATGAFQITASATLVVNGSTSSNYTTTAGDLLFFEGYSATTVRVWAISGGGSSIPYTAASSSGAASLQFAEDTDNGTNKVTLQGAASTADVTVTLPNEAGTLGVIIDEDDMASDSATKVPSQQSVKAYADTKGLTLGTTVASTSGTAIDFTSIPSGVKRITVNLSAVSSNGSSPLQVQIGSGSVTTSGYANATGFDGSFGSATSGFTIQGMAAASTKYGSIVLNHLGSNLWVATHTVGDVGSSLVTVGGGSITLGGVLDRVRVTTVNGTDAFDAGSINISYEK
jgi:hypothetical protein